jgi:hypothetical protein
MVSILIKHLMFQFTVFAHKIICSTHHRYSSIYSKYAGYPLSAVFEASSLHAQDFW